MNQHSFYILNLTNPSLKHNNLHEFISSVQLAFQNLRRKNLLSYINRKLQNCVHGNDKCQCLVFILLCIHVLIWGNHSMSKLQIYTSKYKYKSRDNEKARCLRAFVVLAENPSSASTWQLITICNSIFRGSDTLLFWPAQALHTRCTFIHAGKTPIYTK